MKKAMIITAAVVLIAGAAGFGVYAVNNMLPAEAAQTTEPATEQISFIETSDIEPESMILEIIGVGYMDIASSDEETETPAETESMAANTKPDDESADGDKEDNKPEGTVAGNTETSTGTGTQQQSGNGSSTVQATQGNGNSSTPIAPEPTTGTGSGSGTHAGQTWHPPVYENVWVVDKAAWTEEVPKYESRLKWVCNQCGADCTSDPVGHISNPNSTCGGYHSEYYDVQVGTTTINWPEEGHWEQKLVKEGYWE